MGAADEVSFMYAMNGAYFPAFTARNTLVVVYPCEIVYYLYCFGGTGLFALSAGYTAILTELADLCALVVIVALYHNSGYIVYKMDYTVRAGALTKTAADTLFGVYLGYAALGDGNCITGANLSAVTVAETSEGAEAVSCKVHICRLAGRGAAVDILSFFGKTSTVTSDVCHSFDNLSRLDTENCGDFLSSAFTAGGTKISFISYTLAESLCIALAARKAASAAVCSRKAIANFGCSFVLFNTKKLCRNREESCAKHARTEKEKNGN